MGRTATRPVDRVAERRRAAALARHYRDSERRSIAEIAAPPGARPGDDQVLPLRPRRRASARGQGPLPRHLLLAAGTPARATARAPPTPTAAAAAPAPPRRCGLASAFLTRCAGGPNSTAARRRPTTGHARPHARDGEQALRRLEADDWPAPAAVTKLYGTWACASIDAFADPAEPGPPTGEQPQGSGRALDDPSDRRRRARRCVRRGRRRPETHRGRARRSGVDWFPSARRRSRRRMRVPPDADRAPGATAVAGRMGAAATGPTAAPPAPPRADAFRARVRARHDAVRYGRAARRSGRGARCGGW